MEEFAGYGIEIIFTYPVLSAIARIIYINETYANSLLAVYGYDKSYQVKT